MRILCVQDCTRARSLCVSIRLLFPGSREKWNGEIIDFKERESESQ